MMNPYEALSRNADRIPDTTAVEVSGERLSYAGLRHAALRVAAGLAALNLPGKSVGLMLPNCFEFPIALYGAFAAGYVAVPVSVLLTPRELAHVIRDSKLSLLVLPAALLQVGRQAILESGCSTRLIVAHARAEGELCFEDLLGAQPLAASVPRAPSDHVLTLYTSGSTGLPKGAMISCLNLQSQVEMMTEAFNLGQGHRLLCVLPLFHAFALNALLQCSVHNGSTLVLHPRFEVEACLKSLLEDRITWFAGVPTIYKYLLQATSSRDVRFPDLVCCVSGGAALPVSVGEEFSKRFGVPIYEGYGLTETTVGVTANRAGCHKPGSVGKPYRGVELRIVADDQRAAPPGAHGEVHVRCANLMLGYLGRPEETAQVMTDGWFATGDVGVLDEEGFLTLTGRKSDLIIKGGYNIYPKEVEDVLSRHPQVKEVAVVGVRDELKGERVRAVLAVHAGTPPSDELLRAFLAPVLAKYKHPSEFVLVDELPRGPTGKVNKNRLREMSA